MKRIAFLLAALFFTLLPLAAQGADTLRLGAERHEVYLPKLKGKRVALFSNQTGLLPDGRHIVDDLRTRGVDVRCIFSPEHGFRGTAGAGVNVASSTDPATGLPIVSLYDAGRHGSLKTALLDSVDVVICDFQDVGLRFYTYYITMSRIMDLAAKTDREVMVLDRPNPNGMYVDGPVLDPKYRSGVGRYPIPVVHGMTPGELALMIDGEGWLEDGRRLADRLTVIPCTGYTHATRYALPVAPSPNLRSMLAIYLYPSLCLFEGTKASLGRGTDRPFEMYGAPGYKPAPGQADFTFTPRSVPAAENPPMRDRLCHGVDLSSMPEGKAIDGGFDLSYVIDAYRKCGRPADFFTSFFDLLAGTGNVRAHIVAGESAEAIRASWQDELDSFRDIRAKYLLYPEK